MEIMETKLPLAKNGPTITGFPAVMMLATEHLWRFLLASSVVQDGHGMLPMLADSRRDFAVVKAIAFAVGLVVGGVALGLGF